MVGCFEGKVGFMERERSEIVRANKMSIRNTIPWAFSPLPVHPVLVSSWRGKVSPKKRSDDVLVVTITGKEKIPNSYLSPTKTSRPEN